MKTKQKRNLKLSKIAIAKMSLHQKEIIKGGTLPTSDIHGYQMSEDPDEETICYALK
ncbi:hypothetical protein [uncultured Kordia sp.]|uniref:hypothetical protein n=1 Tax=uncultured Kordia sp. TaxID=507699 RepID=UPI002630FE8F|nr:hypothetical protein [uncultured Kordia sp.]